jgi:hypothetical protein
MQAAHPMSVPATVDATRKRSVTLATVSLAVMAVPFLVLGVWILDRPALTELTCPAGGGPCSLVRAGWMTGSEVARFAPAELLTARVDRNRTSKGANTYRPAFDVGSHKQPLFFKWDNTPVASEALVAQLHAHARSPAQPLVFRDDARRATAGAGGAFTLAGVGVLVLAGWIAWRGRRPAR